MKRRLKGLDRVAYPLFALSKACGLYPVTNNKFSKCLYLYAWIIGTTTSLYCIATVEDFWLPEDPIFTISIVVSQATLLVGWLVYLVYVPKYRNVQKTVEILRKSAEDADIKLPWMPYAFLAIKIGFRIWLVIRRNSWMGIVDNAAYFIAKLPQELLPLQFAIIADVTAQLVAKSQHQLDSLHKDQEASVLLRHHEICQLFREINHFYSPFLVLTIASIFAFIPPISILTLKVKVVVFLKVYLLTELSAPFIVLFILLRSSKALKSQVSQFNGKLNKETRHHESLLQNERIALFINYSLKLTPFVATFKLQYSIITKLIATCITYDIILIQFIKTSSLNTTDN